MGLFDPLRENQPVEIGLPDEANNHRSRVEAVYEDKIVIGAPIKTGVLVPVPLGSMVKLMYTDNVAIYTYSCEVIARSRSNPATITLGKPFETNRIQRRNFVRLDTRLTVTFNRIDEQLAPGKQMFSATTVDLSGGGMMLSTNVKLEKGERLEATVYINEKDPIRVIGKVVRVIENPKAKDKYSVGFEFAVIEELERDRIIKFIFNQQRELRRKGLL